HDDKSATRNVPAARRLPVSRLGVGIHVVIVRSGGRRKGAQTRTGQPCSYRKCAQQRCARRHLARVPATSASGGNLRGFARGIAEGLEAPGTRQMDVRPRQIALPFGTLDLDLDNASLNYGGSRLKEFTILAGYQTHGFRNRYRKRGIGAPLAASVESSEAKGARWIAPYAKVPTTALLRFEHARDALTAGKVRGRLEMLDVVTKTKTDVAGEHVPIESELSAALAFRLEHSPVWDYEIAGFRSGDLSLTKRDADNLYMLDPYVPGRIPVVFVHGTASSPARW